MAIFVKNKSGIIHETTKVIAEELVGRWDVVYVEDPKIGARNKIEHTEDEEENDSEDVTKEEKPKSGRPKAK